jgi:glucose-1-phosphate thymidylyltransferase
MGFPDIIMEPKNAFKDLKEKLLDTNADVVLGIFPIKQYWKWDMIEFKENKIKNIVIKGQRSDLKYGWSNAVWSPAFSRFMHEFLKDLISTNEKGTRILPDGTERELYVGDVFVEAAKNGLKMDYVIFEDGYSTDIGTHDEMLEYIKKSIIER